MQKYHFTDLVAPLYLNERAGLGPPTFSYDPPGVAVLAVDPSRYELSQIVIINGEEQGRKTAHLVSCWAQVQAVADGIRPLDSVGSYRRNNTLPRQSPQPLISLGGDYPGLLLHLLAFQRKWCNASPHWEDWQPGLYFAVAPTSPDESHGLIGVFTSDRRCRVWLYPSQEEGLALLRATGCDKAPSHEPFVLQSTLPVPTQQAVVELAPDLAKWLLFWYANYLRATDSLR